ncbi:beta-defensin 107A-like [Capricornis sumatraensis]|uniref:beta-defensin 107A-like n=1 Tax=Capricornis sumatraensis TaxID=34865 RepID=UPI0036047613
MEVVGLEKGFMEHRRNLDRDVEESIPGRKTGEDKPGAMKTFFFMFAAMILLGQIFSAPRSLQRQIRCLKMDGRCEVECLSFEDKIGGCRAELTPFCCRKRVNN